MTWSVGAFATPVAQVPTLELMWMMTAVPWHGEKACFTGATYFMITFNLMYI